MCANMCPRHGHNEIESLRLMHNAFVCARVRVLPNEVTYLFL